MLKHVLLDPNPRPLPLLWFETFCPHEGFLAHQRINTGNKQITDKISRRIYLFVIFYFSCIYERPNVTMKAIPGVSYPRNYPNKINNFRYVFTYEKDTNEVTFLLTYMFTTSFPSPSCSFFFILNYNPYRPNLHDYACISLQVLELKKFVNSFNKH